MSMVSCPGCGLPRAEEQAGAVPCPVCAAGPGFDPRPARGPPAPDRAAGLPADASELHRHGPTGGFPPWLAGAGLFALGTIAGVAGVLAWRGGSAPDGTASPPAEVASAPRPLPPPRRAELAPLPREYAPRPAPVAELALAPEPRPVPEPPVPNRVTIEKLNLPNESYAVPFPMKKGEKVILTGKVKMLRVAGLDGGAVLDASGLEAAVVYVGGKIDNRSVLKVNAPNGSVVVAAAVGGRSSVEIHAPGGDVKFSYPTLPNRPGSLIDGGSVVTVTARTTDLRGDVNGIETRVTVNLPPSGGLKVAAVRGIATVEYRVGEGRGTADVTVGHVSPTANFRKAE